MKDYLRDYKNRSKVRHVGFSMGVVGMVVGIVAAVIAVVTANGILGGIAAVTIVAGFVLFPVTDINYPAY